MAPIREAFAVTHGRSFEKRFGPVGGGFSFKLWTFSRWQSFVSATYVSLMASSETARHQHLGQT
jgi:hypothetical protein